MTNNTNRANHELIKSLAGADVADIVAPITRRSRSNKPAMYSTGFMPMTWHENRKCARSIEEPERCTDLAFIADDVENHGGQYCSRCTK